MFALFEQALFEIITKENGMEKEKIHKNLIFRRLTLAYVLIFYYLCISKIKETNTLTLKLVRKYAEL